MGRLALNNTPPDIVKCVNKAINNPLKTPDVTQKLAAQGIGVIGGPLEVAKVFVEKQMDIWAKVVKYHAIGSDCAVLTTDSDRDLRVLFYG